MIKGILAGLLEKEGPGEGDEFSFSVLSFEVFKGQVDGESSRQLGVIDLKFWRNLKDRNTDLAET